MELFICLVLLFVLIVFQKQFLKNILFWVYSSATVNPFKFALGLDDAIWI